MFDRDHDMMGLALVEAQVAFERDEVPIGCVVVCGGEVIAVGANATESTGSSLDHAEIVAIRAAQAALETPYLDDCTLYCTVEPCTMCVGAIILARVRRIVFGAREPKTGACESVISITNEPRLAGGLVATGGVRADEARELMRRFFVHRRG